MILPLFVVILSGYVIRETGFVRAGFVDDLNRLVYYVALPALLFLSSSRIDPAMFTGVASAIAFPVVIVMTALFAFAVTITIPSTQRGAVIQAGFRADLAYLGLPITGTLLGDQALGTIAIIIAVGAVTNTILSIVVLSLIKTRGGRPGIFDGLGRAIANPMLLAIALGFTFSVVGWNLPVVADRLLGLLSDMSFPLILLVLGLSLSFSELRDNIASAILASSIKLVVMPSIAWTVMHIVLGSPTLMVNTVVLMAAMPTAVASQSFARAFGADSSVSASSVSLSTLLMPVTVPTLALILGL
ncbi:MAG: AEC family transporter [Spirochaetota bacterium]